MDYLMDVLGEGEGGRGGGGERGGREEGKRKMGATQEASTIVTMAKIRHLILTKATLC